MRGVVPRDVHLLLRPLRPPRSVASAAFKATTSKTLSELGESRTLKTSAFVRPLRGSMN
jgi:hypothetical protein